MDVQEALITMAILMNEEAEFYYNNLKEYEDKGDIFNKDYQEKLEKYTWLRKNTVEFGNRLAAIPMFFNILESWKVYIIGKEGIEGDLTNVNKEEIIEQCSNLATSVKNFLKEIGIAVYMGTDVGKDGWEISIICNELNSKIICSAVYRKFKYAIENKIMFLSRRFIEHHIPGLYNWQDAKRILSLLKIK